MDVAKFDYLAYCDASGDDGVKFTGDRSKGSSWTFSVATLLMKVEDLEYNEGLFVQAKAIAGVPPDREVKYSSLRRMRRGCEMMDVISGLKARLFVGVALKTKFDPSSDYRNPSTRLLSTFTQAFPTAQCSKAIEDTATLGIAIDQQKQVEQAIVAGLLDSIFLDERPQHKPYIEFLDSRTSLMIQCADWCAGAFGDVFERYVRGQLSVHGTQCASCSPQTPLCKWGRLRRAGPEIRAIVPLRDLMLAGRDKISGFDLCVFPNEQAKNCWFINCQLLGQGPLWGPFKGKKYSKKK